MTKRSFRERLKQQPNDVNFLNEDKDSELQPGEQLVRIPKHEIYSGAQVRRKFRNIEELSQNIEAQGQIQPIIVYPRDSKGYKVQKGERRWRAVKMSETLTHLDCIIRENSNVWQQLAENIQRENLDPFEIAFALQEEMEGDKSLDRDAIAARLNKSTTWVSQHIALINVPEFIEAAYEDGVIGDVDTINALRVAAQIDESFVKQALEQNKTISREEAKTITRNLKAKNKASKQTAGHIQPNAPEAEDSTPQPPSTESGLQVTSNDGENEQQPPSTENGLQVTSNDSEKEQQPQKSAAKQVKQQPKPTLSESGHSKQIEVRLDGQKGIIDLLGEAEPGYIVIRLECTTGTITVPVSDVELIGYV